MTPDREFSRLKEALADRYAVERELGSGAMATVYLAEDRKHHDRKVALKVLRPELAASLGAERFHREIEIVAGIAHPHIMPLYDSGEADGLLYYVMPYFPGETLRDRLEREPRLPAGNALELTAQVADGLHHAHDKGIVHRDVKPSNIFLSGDKAVIADFGIARAATELTEEQLTALTATGSSLGTPLYMSPEQAEGDRDVDARSDIYSLGCVLYEMLAGEPPFTGPTTQSVLRQHVAEDPPAITAGPEGVSPDVIAIVERALSKNPGARYPDAARFAEAIRRADRVPSPSLSGIWKTPRGRRILAGILVVVLAVAAGAAWYLHRRSRSAWAKRVAIPEIARLAEERAYGQAFALAEEARPYVGNDPQFAALLPRVSRVVSITTDPPGAEVFYREIDSPKEDWNRLGRSPIDEGRLRLGYLRWRVEKEGYHPVVSIAENARSEAGEPKELRFRLAERGSVPADMVRIPSKELRITLHGFLSSLSETSRASDEYLIDRHEVTNAEFKEFVDSGGYRDAALWKTEIRSGGESLNWDEAVDRFRDETGRRGPSTWTGGTFAPGEGDHPVSGVSWHEAAAYCEFAGKELPTIYHWVGATDPELASQIVPYSNIDNRSDGTSPVGSYQPGIHGLYDMAGNVREWVWNRSGPSRFVLGGAWDEPAYMFYEADARSPLDRSSGNGFRCAEYLAEDGAELAGFREPVGFVAENRDFEPVSDAVFEAYESQYLYDPAPLDATVEEVDDGSQYWRKEKVTFDAAYGDERVPAFLFLPRNVEPPYQAVVHWPYSGAILRPSSDDLGYVSSIDFIVQSGRAVIYPVYKGTYERNDGLETWVPDTSQFYADHVIQAVQDLMRSVDYLEAHEEIDVERLAYYGTSWGGFLGPIPLAVEERFEAGILLAGGFPPTPARPEVTEYNFAPRVTVPVLVINGRYDFIFPLETSQRPMLDLLGTPEEDKKHLLFETGHSVYSYRAQPIQKAILDWLDRYLGPVE